jgi:hypothetical protein
MEAMGGSLLAACEAWMISGGFDGIDVDFGVEKDETIGGLSG